MEKMRLILPCLLVFTTLSTTPVSAHPNGTSKVNIYLFPDKIEFTMDVNADDILNLVIDRGSWKLNQKEREHTCRKMAYYFENHLRMEIDGTVASPMKVLKWLNGKEQLDESMDSVAFAISTFVFRFAYSKDPNASSMDISTSMFAEFEIQAICILNVYWKDQKIMDEQYLALDNVLTIDLQPASLDAMAEKHAEKVAAALRKDSGGISFLYWIGLGVVLILAIGIGVFLVFRKKKG